MRTYPRFYHPVIAIGCLLLGAAPLKVRSQEQQQEPARPKPKEAGAMVTLSDFGAEDIAYLSLPQQAPRGGIVVVHDRWGLDDNVKALTDALAREGFIVVAVDVYNGQKTTDPDRALKLAGDVRYQSAAKTILAGARLLKTSPKLKVPYVGVVGYGIGSPLALTAAAAQTEPLIDAVTLVEGPLENSEAVISRLKRPVLGIFSRQRVETPPHTVAIFEQMMRSHDNSLRVVMVDGGPGFTDSLSGQYNQASARQAWKEMTAFMGQRLSQPPPEPGIMDKLENGLDKGLDSMKNLLP